MIVYEVPGKQHTAETLRLAAERARAADVHLVVASTAGDTALAALDAAEAAGISRDAMNQEVARTRRGWARRGKRVPLVVRQLRKPFSAAMASSFSSSGWHRGSPITWK